MSLSNTSLQTPVSELGPIQLVYGHGDIIHLGVSSGFVSVACPTFQRSFLICVAMFKLESCILGAAAYRIPGLRYHFTLAGRMGLLMKEQRVVGRFLWATPTCACPKMGEAEIVLEDIPLPRPNGYQYGH